jgi:hypothetical protein
MERIRGRTYMSAMGWVKSGLLFPVL